MVVCPTSLNIRRWRFANVMYWIRRGSCEFPQPEWFYEYIKEYMDYEAN